MNFIIDNYIWFIIIGVVLLMIVIGYYAEKTEFGKKFLSMDNNVDNSNQETIIHNNINTDLNQGIYNKDTSNVTNEVPQVSQNLTGVANELSKESIDNSSNSSGTVTMDFTDDDVWKF